MAAGKMGGTAMAAVEEEAVARCGGEGGGERGGGEGAASGVWNAPLQEWLSAREAGVVVVWRHCAPGCQEGSSRGQRLCARARCPSPAS